MKKNFLDFILSECLILLILGFTGTNLWLARNPIKFFLGDFASVGFVFLFLLLYGGYTAITLALFNRVFPFREGDYTTPDFQFTLWKVRHVLEQLGRRALTLFFPDFIQHSLFALLGARVGCEVAIAGDILDPVLTTVEEGGVLGVGTIVTAHAMAGNRFILRRVHIERNATIGVGCILMPGVRVGAGAVVLPGSVLKAHTHVPPGETWGGSPAERVRPKVPPIQSLPTDRTLT
jgi:serine acetyltransferase